MNKTITLSFLITLSLFGMFFILWQIPDTQATITIQEIEPLNVQKHIDYSEKINDFYWIEMLAETNANLREYELHKYDCTQFSMTLVETLKSYGYKAQCTSGHTPNWEYPDHTWVSVWIDDIRYEIEAVTGEFIMPTDYKENYQKVWEGRCW